MQMGYIQVLLQSEIPLLKYNYWRQCVRVAERVGSVDKPMNLHPIFINCFY